MPVKAKPSQRPTTRRATENSASARHRGTKEATRERLLTAAIELITERGAEGVTTVSVTRRAGFTQSIFYLHFANVDACLRAAAEKVAGEVRAFIAENRRRTHEAVIAGAASPVAHFQAMLRLFIERRPFAELLLYRRHDRSPVGDAMRAMNEGIRADLIADAWSLARSMGVSRRHYKRVAFTAELLHAQVQAAGEAILDGRFTDTEMLARELAAAADATIQSALARAAPPPRSSATLRRSQPAQMALRQGQNPRGGL